MNLKASVLIALALVSARANADVKYWINEPEKTIVAAPNPTLKIRLTKLDVDDSYYGQLTVSLNYSGADMDGQLQALMAGFSGYKLQRAILEKGDRYQYTIPFLGVSQTIDPTPGVDGPFIEDTRYLTKTQFKAAESELAAQHPLAQFTGSLNATVPLMKVVEHKELDASTCSTLIGDDHSVGATLVKMMSIGPQIFSGLTFQYDSTRAALLADLKNGCFDLARGGQVDSFDDLLKLKINPKGRSLVGETSKKVYDKQSIPLTYEVQQSGDTP